MATKRATNSSIQMQDAWINYYRGAMALLTTVLLAVVGYMGRSALENQANMLAAQTDTTAQIAVMNERGAQNRKDIKDIKTDLKSTQAKVESIGESVIRLESMH